MARRLHSRDTLPHLRTGEAPGPGLKRVLLACLDAADRAKPSDLHRKRLALKRARAVLRLVQDAGAARTTALRRQLSTLARRLAAARDREVTADLAIRAARHLKPAQRAAALSFADALRHRARPVDLRIWSKRLRTLRDRVKLQPIAVLTTSDLVQALARTARRIRRRGRRPDRARDVHSLRKAAVALRLQLLVARPLLEASARSIEPPLANLVRKLGRYRDWRRLRRAAGNRNPALATYAAGPQDTSLRKAVRGLKGLRRKLARLEAAAG